MAAKRLKILPLGGLGEIGINCMVVEWDRSLILIDCGIQFPDATHPGVELFLPDLSYVLQRMDSLEGVVVTHGHDDHIGAIPFLSRHRKIDVYCTPFPRGLLEHKLSEDSEARGVTFHEIKPLEPFKVGPFTIHPIPVQHSIIESLGLGIETPEGILVHSGDFKHDANPVGGEVIGLGPFEQLGKRGVLCLLSDSTNAERSGHTLSEVDVERSFEGIFRRQQGRLIIACFASNIRRIGNLLSLAHRLGKKVALVGRSMHGYTRLAHEQGSLQIPEDTLILAENTQRYPDDKIVILATGSQAEPQSALVRMAHDTHKEVQLKPGDLVILSSRFIPGNEKAISSMINQLYRQGAEVLYESLEPIHTSGHGCQDELKLLHQACRPRFFVPVHGEYRMLAKHGRLAAEWGTARENVYVIENGQSLEFEGGRARLGDRVGLQKAAIVMGAQMEPKATVFAQRFGMAKAGIVFAAVFRDARTKRLIGVPALATHGLLFREGTEPDAVHEDAEDLIEETCDKQHNHPSLAELLRLELRRFFKRSTCYKPIVIAQVFDV